MSGNNVRSTNPTRPDDVVVEAPASTQDDVAKAAQAARAAQKEWQATPPAARSAAIAAAAEAVAGASDELTELMVREVGKPRSEAAGEAGPAGANPRHHPPPGPPPG